MASNKTVDRAKTIVESILKNHARNKSVKSYLELKDLKRFLPLNQTLEGLNFSIDYINSSISDAIKVNIGSFFTQDYLQDPLNLNNHDRLDDYILQYYIEDIESVKQFAENVIDSKPIYWIEFKNTREIYLNDQILLGKPDFGRAPHLLFEYLYENPNVIVTRDQIQAIKGKVPPRFDTAINGLGFRGELKKLFFNISKYSILFRKVITQQDLNNFDVDLVKLKKQIGDI